MRHDHRYRICFVCSGNICRSPIAEVVMRHLVTQAGLDDAVEVDSAGTGDWHIGERADRRAVAALAHAGYDGSQHRARQFDPAWFSDRDLVIALDRGHLRTLRSWAPTPELRERVRMLRSFDPALAEQRAGQDLAGVGAQAAQAALAELDVADPFYDGPEAFDAVLHQIEAACEGLLAHVRRDLESCGHPDPVYG